jgi:hypothetical protein
VRPADYVADAIRQAIGNGDDVEDESGVMPILD